MAWLATFVMGLILGLLGGGGGILAVPILVTLFGLRPTMATGGSLVVVGASALVGAFLEARKGRLDVRGVLRVGIPAAVGSTLARGFVLPRVPPSMLGVSTEDLTMMAFATLMLAVGVRMFAPTKNARRGVRGAMFVAAAGFGVGVLGGLLGAGGGFLIIPLLTLGLGEPMTAAVPTSLGIIGVQSAAGVLADLSRPYPWAMLGGVVLVAMVGMVAGVRLRKSVDPEKLKKGFGALVLLVAVAIFAQIVAGHPQAIAH